MAVQVMRTREKRDGIQAMMDGLVKELIADEAHVERETGIADGHGLPQRSTGWRAPSISTAALLGP